MTNDRQNTSSCTPMTPLGVALYAIAVFLTAVIQSCLYRAFDFFGTIPSLTLAFTVAAGHFDGERTGGVTGLCSGFLTDALGSAAFSFLPLAYCVIGYFVGVSSAACRGKTPAAHCFVSYCLRLAASVGVGATVTVFAIFFSANTPNIISAIFLVALPESVISFVFGLAFWCVYRLIYIKRRQNI